MAGDQDYDPADGDVLDTAEQASKGNPAALKYLILAFVALAGLGGLVISTIYVAGKNLGESAFDAVQTLTEDEEEEEDENNNDDGFWSAE